MQKPFEHKKRSSHSDDWLVGDLHYGALFKLLKKNNGMRTSFNPPLGTLGPRCLVPNVVGRHQPVFKTILVGSYNGVMV